MGKVQQSQVANNSAASLPHAGAERLKADYRMYSGLLLTLGLCAAYGAFADIVSLADTAKSGLPLATLIAAVFQGFFGLTCMGVGFTGAVMDKGSTLLTTIAASSIQLAWMPFLVGLSTIGMGIVSDPSENPFIPAIYDPSAAAVKFVGSMAFLGLMSYAIGFIGSLGFMAFSMHSIQAGKPQDRSGVYFRGRAKLYNGLLFLAGLVQLMLGSFIINTYGNGPLAAPIFAVVFLVFSPEISVTVGLLQMVVATIGIVRSLRKNPVPNSVWFQTLCFFMYFCMMSMQVLAQVAQAPGDAAAFAAPTLACVYLGIALMPAFLDWKMNNLPEDLDAANYYGVPLLSEKEQPAAGRDDATLELEEVNANDNNV